MVLPCLSSAETINSLRSGGGTVAQGSTYQGYSAIGGSIVGASTQSGNNIFSGIFGVISRLSGSSAVTTPDGGSDTTSPIISTVKIDGRLVVSGDYIRKDAILTAVVTDETSLSLPLSSVEIDGTSYPFSNLGVNSTFEAINLTFRFALSAGTHEIKINGVDSSQNKKTITYSLVVDESSLKATGVLLNPNPFNPSSGPAKIGYQLSKEGDTSIFIFDTLGQLVYRKNYLSGSEGAHVGYNEVDWDGKSNSGEYLSNDAYFLRVVSANKAIGRTKIAIIR